jgi:polysaccharide pyruvyl transferase WcaK-like protein
MKPTKSLIGSKKANNLATLLSQERLNLRETMKQTESREWIARYRKKALEEGRGEAQYWWQQTLIDIAKRRGQAAADELRQRMNRIKNEESRPC